SDLRSRLASQITPATEVLGANGCLEILQDDFNGRYPLVLRRLDYFNRRQIDGELFTDFISKLEELSKLADLDKLTTDDILVFSSLCGTKNKELLDDLLKVEDPNLKKIKKAARVFESKATTKAKLKIADAETISKIEKPRQPRHPGNQRQDWRSTNKSQPRGSTKPTPMPAVNDDRPCGRCNVMGHHAKTCSWPKDTICKGCKKRGHIKPACRERKA
ncbi:LYR motif-containing 4, partial [Paramuricea clavata]